MTKDQLEIFIRANEESTERIVRATVNGKIDKIAARLDQHIEDNRQHNEMDKEWKQKAQPAIDAFTNLSGTGKMLVMVAGGIATIIGAVIAIKTLIIK